MDLIKKMEQLGANKSQLTSGTLALAIRAIAEDESIVPDTIRLEITRLANSIESASKRLENAQSEIQYVLDSAKSERKQIENEAEKATQNYEIAKRREASAITDKDLAEAVKAYREVLQATKDVFGFGELDKETQIAAVNAGSYIAWRGIMGGKFKEEDQKKVGRFI